MHSYSPKGIILLLCIVCAPVFINAQVITADITGQVFDQSSAAIVNAIVTARNQSTGQTRTVQTSGQGDYSIRQLPPGKYELFVEAANFSKVLIKDIDLNVGTKQAINIELKPGEISEIVEISNPPNLLETSKSELGNVVTPREVQNLPIMNRTFAALSIITPEARPAGNFDPTKTRVGNVAFSGGDGRQVSVNVDGGDNKDNIVGSLLQNFAYESIQEFQVIQHGWTAESGRAVGGVVNVITKSGTNTIRGSFFSNFRDETLRAKSFFEDRDDRNKPSFSRQEIGGSLGGHIIRDKLFFFSALEHFREKQNIFTSTNVLTQLAAIPGAQPQAAIPIPYDDTLLTIKIDHLLNDTQKMFYRYSQQSNRSPNDQITDPANTDLTGGNTNDNKFRSFVFNYMWTLSPTKLNQWYFHYQDFKNEILSVTDRPNLIFPGNIQTGANVNVPQASSERKIQLRDDLSIQKGKNGLKVGLNYIYTKLGGFFFFAKGYQLTFFDSPTTISKNTNGKYPNGFATPGAVRTLTFSDGEATHDQAFHQLALYAQDDYKITSRLTLNLGLRWDANIGVLVDQTNNRTIKILQQIDHPLAKAITADPAKLAKRTPSWLEFQPRVGFAFDTFGSGRMVIRGGYGIFYDQIFQNLTFFSLQQTRPTIFQSLLLLTNSTVGVGDPFLKSFRFGIDQLPPPPAEVRANDLARGAFGRINDPDIKDPYVQKLSIGLQFSLGSRTTLSSDYVHALGLHEPRVQVINPQIQHICNPIFNGATPASPFCVREATGGTSRLFDSAFINAGLGVNRLAQINMIGTTNRSLLDSWTTQLRYQARRLSFTAGYVLSSSRSWGGQPVSSYNGNSIAITPEQQFRPEEFGPTRFDERHRIVVSGIFDLPSGFQVSHIFQLATARPYSPTTGLDIDGDGLAINDRLCEGVAPLSVIAVRGNSEAILRLNPRGCVQAKVNSMRDGFAVNSAGRVEKLSGRYLNIDLRLSKTFNFSERFNISSYVDIYNLLNVDNLSFAERRAVSPATSQDFFLQPISLYGNGFGQPVGRPFTLQLGFRLSF